MSKMVLLFDMNGFSCRKEEENSILLSDLLLLYDIKMKKPI